MVLSACLNSTPATSDRGSTSTIRVVFQQVPFRVLSFALEGPNRQMLRIPDTFCGEDISLYYFPNLVFVFSRDNHDGTVLSGLLALDTVLSESAAEERNTACFDQGRRILIVWFHKG